MQDAALDAKYTTESLSESLTPALKSLQRISKLVEDARKDVRAAMPTPAADHPP